jgi:hypothetical protein
MDPIFLQVDYQQEFIYLFIVCDYFKDYSISERIESIFTLIKFDCPSILGKYSIAVEAFSEQEFTDLLRMERNANKQIAPRKK